MTIEAFPLTWPDGWPRTPARKRERSQFNQTPGRARSQMLKEIRLLVGYRYRRENVILSTDIALRLDGEPYAGRRAPDDPGVAVYFPHGKKNMVFACDRWDRIHDNIHAIGKTIGALRGIERWGASDMLERAFTGFVALEHQDSSHWRDILQVRNRIPGETNAETLKLAERNFKILAKEHHPDREGGSNMMMQALLTARDSARQELTQDV